MDNVSKQDMRTIFEIADRAMGLSDLHRNQFTKLDLVMDLTAVHETSPLRLDDLLTADQVNFVHDIFGSVRNLNRETRQLENCWTPRYSA